MSTDVEDPLSRVMLSSALAVILRGRFCDIVLQGRDAPTFAEDQGSMRRFL
jgi:hypothetical protein